MRTALHRSVVLCVVLCACAQIADKQTLCALLCLYDSTCPIERVCGILYGGEK